MVQVQTMMTQPKWQDSKMKIGTAMMSIDAIIDIMAKYARPRGPTQPKTMLWEKRKIKLKMYRKETATPM